MKKDDEWSRQRCVKMGICQMLSSRRCIRCRAHTAILMIHPYASSPMNCIFHQAWSMELQRSTTPSRSSQKENIAVSCVRELPVISKVARAFSTLLREPIILPLARRQRMVRSHCSQQDAWEHVAWLLPPSWMKTLLVI